MRGKLLRVVAVLCGLAGAVYAADRATEPDAVEDIDRVITAQHVNEGRLARRAPLDDPALQTNSAADMIDLSQKYGEQMKIAVEHAEDVRLLAYRSHDIIRMTCIEDKVAQMHIVLDIAQPRLASLRATTEVSAMREQFTVISQVLDRMKELSDQVDACLGDSLDAINAGRIEEETPIDDNINDPTRPPTPIVPVDRPPEASPYY
jgi:hypothetical protein